MVGLGLRLGHLVKEFHNNLKKTYWNLVASVLKNIKEC